MNYGFLETWDAFLPRAGGHVVAIFGGGGKTSLLRAAAEALWRGGTPVVVTTTTRTEPLDWPGLQVMDWEEFGAGGPAAAGGGAAPGGLLCVRRGFLAEGKWLGLAPEEVEELARRLPERVVLVEADGSGGLPVKLHRPDEPVWPRICSLAIAVMGLSAVGAPLGRVLHRLGRLSRPGVPEDPATPCDWDVLWRLLAGPDGYLERVPPGVPAAVALLQLGAARDSVGLFGFLARVMGEGNVPLVVLGELAGPEAGLRTAYRRDEAAAAAPGGEVAGARPAARRDWAVILARGDSARMGCPKGLCRLPGEPDGPAFLARIAGLYAGLGWPVAVVTKPELVEPYRSAAAAAPAAAIRWIARPGGGGTAASVAAAVSELATEATHLWLHPVDLPEVSPATVAQLAARSRACPVGVLVPTHGGAPGHPVVLPMAVGRDLAGTAPGGAMRDLLLAWTAPGSARRAEMLEVEIADPGVTADRDVPDAGEE